MGPSRLVLELGFVFASNLQGFYKASLRLVLGFAGYKTGHPETSPQAHKFENNLYTQAW